MLKVDKTNENISRCICLNCPSYSTTCKLKNAPFAANLPTKNLAGRTHFEKMFCAFEKSNCIHMNKGCICEECANYKEYNLQNCTYCIHTGGTDECLKR